MKKPIITKYRKLGLFGFGIAASLSPIAIAASCGSSDEAAPVAQTIDTSQVDLSSISVGGIVTNPVLSLGGAFLPTNTKLQYKVGASDWLDEAALKVYITTNASKLTDSNLSAVKVRLTPISDKYKLSAPVEGTLRGKISREEKLPEVISINTSAADLSAITVSGTTDAPIINLNGFIAPENTILLFKAGASAWLNEAGIKAYIISNFASLSVSELSSIKAHLEPSSIAYTLTSDREVTLAGSITKQPIPINIDNVNLSVISLSGTTVAPIINLNNFSTPANTILLFKVGSSEWLSEEGIKAYIIQSAATLTSLELNTVKARLAPISIDYSLANDFETTISSSIKLLILIDTSAVDLNLITVSGTTNAPFIYLNGFVTPANLLLLFQVGTSPWLDDVALRLFIIQNAATLTDAQLSAVKAKLEPKSSDYALTAAKEATLGGAITKPVNQLINNRSAMITALNNIAYFSPNANSSDTKPQTISVDNIAKSYEFLSGEYATLNSAKNALSSEWKTILPRTISFDKSKRNLWLRVTVKTLEELGASSTITSEDLQTFNGDNRYFDLTDASQIRTIKSDIAQLPEMANFSLDNILVVGNKDKTVINMTDVSLPSFTAIEFLINNTTVGFSELSTYINNNQSSLTTTQLDNIVAKLVVQNPNVYVLSTPKQSTLKYTSDAPLSIEEWKVKFPQFANKIVDNKVADSAFSGSTLGIRELPSDFTLPKGITFIDERAFMFAKLPPKFVIPFSVIRLGDFSFYSAVIPIGFTLSPNINTIDRQSFQNVTFPKGFVIPEGVRKIGLSSFNGTTFQPGFVFPSVLDSFRLSAFSDAKYSDGTPL